MANIYTCLYYHVIFSTKRRERWITQDIEQRVWAYLGGIACQNNLKPLLIGGVDDHVHMLLSMPPSISVSEAIKRIKGGSSGWVKDNFHGLKRFGWQDGYGAFTVSKTQIPEVDEYIRNQREHHRLKTFQEEYRAFLDKHEIEYDERYLWD
jgi:REP element-mobilizing transposase RayT